MNTANTNTARIRKHTLGQRVHTHTHEGVEFSTRLRRFENGLDIYERVCTSVEDTDTDAHMLAYIEHAIADARDWWEYGTNTIIEIRDRYDVLVACVYTDTDTHTICADVNPRGLRSDDTQTRVLAHIA